MEKKRVLVIDDTDILRKVIERVLTRDGCDVVLAACGADGIEQARSGQFDVIICDVLMPGLSGVHVVETLRGDGNQTPIWLMSGDTGEFGARVQVLVQDHVVSGLIAKPFLPRVFRDVGIVS